MELKTFFAQDLLGNVIPSPTAYLYMPGTTTLATGLQNETGGALTNPWTGNVNGKISVAAPDGDYDLRVTGAGRDSTMRVRFIDSTANSVQLLRDDLAIDATGKGADQIAATGGSGATQFSTVKGFITRILSSVGSALVGFIQSGPGAVARTVQADLRERVNIKQFGGVGDGVNDDTQAFINANALGRAINLPPGEWVITQPVAFSVSLFGESAYDARTVIRLDGAGQLIVDDAYILNP